MQTSEVAMMSVFNIENRKMEEIKQMKNMFKNEEFDKFLKKNAKLVKNQAT